MRKASTLETRQAAQAGRTKGQLPEIYQVTTIGDVCGHVPSELDPDLEILVLVAGQSRGVSCRAQAKDCLNELDLEGSFRAFRPVLHDQKGKHVIERHKLHQVVFG